MSNTISPKEMLEKVSTPTDTATTTTTSATTTNVVSSVNAARIVRTVTPEASEDPILSQFKTLIANYLEKQKSKITSKINMDIFVPIVNYILLHQDNQAVLDYYRKFFISYRNSYLTEFNALRGINELSFKQRERVTFVYSLMSELTNPKRNNKYRYDFTYADSILTEPKCKVPNGFVIYISSRMR